MDEEDDRKAFISRIGTFFLLVGVLVIILFVASDLGDQTYFRYFFLGGILLLIGLVFKRMGASPPAPSKRFEKIRKLQQKKREAEEKKETQKNDPKKSK